MTDTYTTPDRETATGIRVEVLTGRHRGRVGTLVRYDRVSSGMDYQTVFSYPVVELDPTTYGPARTVRVIAVRPAREAS